MFCKQNISPNKSTIFIKSYIVMSPLVYYFLNVSQRAFTCSELTIETQEQGVESAQN